MLQSRRAEPRQVLKRDATWTVQSGDTGYGISIRLSINFAQLSALNPGVQWQALKIGQVLKIPCDDGSDTGSTAYTVVAGDTGNQIAAAYGISFEALANANPQVTDWRLLQIGQILIIPSSAPGGATSTVTISTSSLTSSTITTGSSTDGISSTTASTIDLSSTVTSSFTTDVSIPTTTSSMTPGNAVNFTSTSAGSTGDLSSFTRVLTTVTTTQTGDPVITPPEVPTTTSINGSSTIDVPAQTTTPATNSTDPGIVEPEPYPTNGTNTFSPFLTPGETKRSVQIGTPAPLKLVKLRLVRNDLSAEMTQYVVKSGDTGYAIAAKYDITFSSLSDANPSVTWENLQINQVLNIPGKASCVEIPTTTNQLEARKASLDTYTLFTGPAKTPPYPPISAWMSFDSLWTANLANIGINCAFAAGTVPRNTQTETANLKRVVQAVASDTAVNPSFILAIVLQESAGCVRAPTTKSWEGFTNPGLMQSFRGRGTCNANGRLLQPCPDFMMTKMISDGVTGNVNVGVLPALRKAAESLGIDWPYNMAAANGVDEALLYYQAARIYNSGSLPADGNLSGVTGSTKCYVSDVANRLVGWVNAKRKCY